MNTQNLFEYFRRPPERKLMFIHIPKTAGTSLVHALHSIYFDAFRPHKRFHFSIVPSASLAAAYALEHDLRLVRSCIGSYAMSLQNIRLVTGHQPCVEEYFEPRFNDFLKVSILREPVARFISEYLYNRYKKQSHASVSVDLVEYLESDAAKRSGRALLRTFVDVELGCEVESRHMQEALCLFERLDLKGTVERMDDFLSALSESVGKTVDIPHTNRSPSSRRLDSIEPELMARVEELCADDISFYREAIKLI